MKEGGIIAGASRARTDGLVIANDGVLQIASFACLHLQSSHVPLHSKTFSKFQVRRESCLTVFPARPWLQARHFLTRPQPRMFTAQSRLASPAWPAIFVANKKSCSAHLLKLQEKTIEL